MVMSSFSRPHIGISKCLVSQYEISTLSYSWALRCDLKSIIDQCIFNPFPKNLLLDLVESKKIPYFLINFFYR